jgi:hypothetical protein
MYVHLTNTVYALLMPMSPRAPSIGSLGPWTPPLLAGLFGTRDKPPSMYVRFMDLVCGLLIPVAQPTVRARRL